MVDCAGRSGGAASQESLKRPARDHVEPAQSLVAAPRGPNQSPGDELSGFMIASVIWKTAANIFKDNIEIGRCSIVKLLHGKRTDLRTGTPERRNGGAEKALRDSGIPDISPLSKALKILTARRGSDPGAVVSRTITFPSPLPAISQRRRA
jgi:hypothetical protein